MSVSSFIARRYFFSRKKTRFLPFLTAIAIGGVAVGTCALVVIMSVMYGFREELEHRLLGFSPHISIIQEGEGRELTKEAIASALGSAKTTAIVPFVEGEVIVEAKVGDELFAQGAKLRGVARNSPITSGSVRYEIPRDGPLSVALTSSVIGSKLPGIVLGKEILATLNVHPDFKDTIEVIAPLADVGPTGELEPRLRRFQLTGAFSAGIYEYDTHYALVNMDEARKTLGAQATEGWQLRLDSPEDAPEIVASLMDKLGAGWRVEGWHERNKRLFAALKLERVVMSAVLTLVVLIASFSVIGVIMMIASSKRKDIALFKSMGMPETKIRGVFIRQGMWIGIIGSLIGCIVGTLICLAIAHWPIHLPQAYYLETLEVMIMPIWTAVVAVVGVLLAMVAAIYPVRMTTKEDPIVALRYE